MSIESMTFDRSSDLARRAAIHSALADPGRLAIVDHLLLGDASPSELQELLSTTSNLLAHHLRLLERAGVVRRRRSQGDRRRTYLRLVPEALETLVPSMRTQAERVVFVCTQNSARSQMAVAVWNRRSTMPATSAGTHPAPRVHPGAVAAVRRRNLPMPPSTPQHLDDVLTPADLVIAVCDQAHESLPRDARRVHWSIPDPAIAAGDDAFDRALDDLENRIDRIAPILQPIPQRSRT